MSEWKEVNKEGQVSTWKPVEGEVLEGVLTGITRDVGVNKSTIYEVTTKEDEKVAVWETAVLRSKLDQVPLQSEVKMVYLGKKKSKSGPGSYNDFQVFSRPQTKSDEEVVFS